MKLSIKGDFKSRLMAVIAALAFMIMASAFTVNVSAAGSDGADTTGVCTTKVTYSVNPLYQSVLSLSDIKFADEEKISAKQLFADVERCKTTDDAAVKFREGLKNREETIKVPFELKGTDYNAEKLINLENETFNKAFNHTGVGDEGDYLKWGYSGIGMQIAYGKSTGDTLGSYIFYVTYYTTDAQEKAVTNNLNNVSSQLGLANKNEYEKIFAVYKYICDNVKYNRGSSELKYTCYAAAINKSAVCQGYALMAYRLLNDAGVDCRMIAGTTSSGAHGWNIVKIGDYYYNFDATWDAGNKATKYHYFLKCENSFTNHKRWSDYTSSEFKKLYPMSSSNYNAGKVGTSAEVTGLVLNKNKVSLKKGASTKLVATVDPDDASDKTVTWKSSDSSVATVAKDGKVTAKGEGTCVITASSAEGTYKDECYVTVKASGKVKVKSVKLNKSRINLKKGKTFKLKATFNPTNATNKNLVWKSNNKKIATINKKGVVKAKKPGICTITITTKDGNKKAYCKVIVK